MRPHYKWTPESLAKVGRIPDQALSDELGVSLMTVGNKRRSLGLAPGGKEQAPNAMRLDAELMTKIKSLEPVLIARYQAAGLPLKNLEPSQIVEIAVNELLAASKKATIKTLYAVRSSDV